MRNVLAVLEALALAALFLLGACVALSGAEVPPSPNKVVEQATKATIEGRWMIVQKRYDEAIEKLQLAVSLQPGHPEAMKLLAQARAVRDEVQGHLDKAAGLAKAGRWDEAIQEINAATNIYPSCKDAKALLLEINRKAGETTLVAAQGLLAAGKLDEADAALRQALDYAPDMPAAREGLARVASLRADAAAGQELWGQTLLWAREAVDWAPKVAEYQAAAQAARERVVERLGFSVGPTAPDGPAPTALATSFTEAMWRHLADRKVDFLIVAAGPGAPKPAAYVVRADVGPLVIREERTRAENRTFRYTVQKEEPNPDYARTRDLLDVALANLTQLRADYDRPCPTCNGVGLALCRNCGGTGLAPGPAGAAPCLVCGLPGGRPGWVRCWRCGGTGHWSRVSALDIRRAQDDADRLQDRLARTPPLIVRQVGADWPYTVEYFEKTGTLEASLRITHSAGGQAIYTEALRRHLAKEDTAIQNANPAIGLAAKAPKLPPDEKVRDALIDEAGDEAATKVLTAVARARAADRQAASDKLAKEGKAAEAVEAAMDAAVIKEAVSPQEAARQMTDLRARLRMKPLPARVPAGGI